MKGENRILYTLTGFFGISLLDMLTATIFLAISGDTYERMIDDTFGRLSINALNIAVVAVICLAARKLSSKKNDIIPIKVGKPYLILIILGEISLLSFMTIFQLNDNIIGRGDRSLQIKKRGGNIMNEKLKGKAKRLISGFVAAATAITMLPANPAMAEDLGRYPYTLFAGSSAEGAITTTASNFGVNGNVATNGTISAAGNMNINGTKTENAGLDMIYIFDKIDSKYFSGNNVEEHTEDYVLDELNINISEPTEILGEAELTGNININTALKAFKDVTLNGEVKNTNDSVIYSKYGDIVIDSTNVNLNGLVYAPFGSVEVKAMNLNLNNVVIIADSIVFDCPNVNANYSTNAADFVGTVSEPLNIPKDEWQYMKDENENGLPDFFENFENWSKLADTDGDGLPDSIEEYLGSDPNNIDTDGDGLNDFYEVFGTYTDPTKADTDDNGANDGDEDFDEDGLTNLEEFDNKTNPYIADTDSDGLSDGDEVKTHGTDPLVADTDGDGLDDGDEIVLGTNPLVQDTDGDGIIDSKEKIQQTFTHKVKNEDCAVTEVIVDMECTGNINRTTSVESVMNVDILCTDVVGLVGEPFEIETTSEFDKATLTFKIDKNKLGEIPFDNLLFLWYNEEENRFDELETILDEDHSTVSIVTTHFSKYMVVDRQAWFDNWREIYARFEKLSEKSPSITAICVDCSGSMSTNDPFFYIEQYTKTCYRDLAVQQFVEAMFANDKTSIITFASSAKEVCPLTSDKELLNKNAKFYSSGGTNANAAINIALQQLVGVHGNKSIILMSDGDVNVSDDNLEKAQTNDIKIHAVALGQGANSYALKNCAEKTYGEFFIVKTAVELKSIYDKLSAENQFNFGNLPDSDGDGVPDDIEISGVPMPSGKLVFLDPTNPDTDGDGLSDGDEVGKLSRNYAPSDVPDCAVTYKFSFDVTSDPTMVDSDKDGILDPFDDHPFDAIPPRVKEIIDFFDGAELFEIKYILDKMYVLIDDKDDLDSIETAIKIIKIFREYKGTSNPRGLIQRMLDEGVYGRDGWIAFWDTIFPQMSVSAVWLSEYELYSNGTSFADLTQTAYEQWS